MKLIILLLIVCPLNSFAQNAARARDLAIITDLSIEECNSDRNKCENLRNGTGCFPLRPEKDMFKRDRVKAEALFNFLQRPRLISENNGNCGGPVTSSGTEMMHEKCRTLLCTPGPTGVPGVCKRKMICRKADRFEIPIGNVLCEPPLTLNSRNVCDFPGVDPAIYLSAIVDFEGVVDPETRAQALTGIKTWRAMEYLFATQDKMNDRHVKKMDCLGFLGKFRDEFLDLRRERLNAVYKLNQEFLRLEKEQLRVIEVANLKDEEAKNDKKVHFINGDLLSTFELKSRLTTGYDMQVFLLRKNEIFLEYDREMNRLALEAQKVVNIYPHTVGTPDDRTMSGGDPNYQSHTNKKWSVQKTKTETPPTPGSSSDFTLYDSDSDSDATRACRDMTGVGPFNDEIQDKWHYFYRVNATRTGIKNFIDTPGFATYMTLIGDRYKPSDAPALTEEQFIKQWKIDGEVGPVDGTRDNLDGMFKDLYHLLDFPFPGKTFSGIPAISYHEFGNPATFHDSSGRERSLEQDTAGLEYFKLIRDRIYEAFYKSQEDLLYTKDTGGSSVRRDENEFRNATGGTGFLELFQDPDLVRLDARGCSNPQIKETKQECIEFDNYAQQISTMVFAQAWAYSVHNKWQYEYFFSSPRTWRHKLFHFYTDQLGFVTKYYDASIKIREEVAGQLGASIDGLGEFFDESTSGGVAEGGDFFDKGDDANNGPRRRPNKPTKRFRPSGFDALKLNKPFSSLITRSINGEVLKINSSAAANINGASSGALKAANERLLASLKEKNKKAIAKGADIKAAKDKLLKASLKLSGNKSANTNAANLNSAGANANLGAAGARSRGLNIEDETNKDKSETTPTGEAVSSSEEVIIGEDGQAYSPNPSGQSPSGSSNQDSSGLSQEDKDVIMANFERGKEQYSPKEEDNLFTIMSKAYVRNLDKILILRKKREQ